MRPRRALNVYSSSSRKSAKSSHSRPLSSISDDDSSHGDITVTEMSRRMLKRSLSGVKDVGNVDAGMRTETLVPKKRRPLVEINQRRNGADNSTPVPRTPSRHTTRKDSPRTSNNDSKFSSPLASGRQIITRVGSRKENQHRPNTSLAPLSSPFSKKQDPGNVQITQSRDNLLSQPRPKRAKSNVLQQNSTKRTNLSSRSRQSTLKRHASAAQPSKKTIRQEWLVPPAKANPILHSTSHAHAFDFSFTRESSFFAHSPQAFSTPVHKRVLSLAPSITVPLQLSVSPSGTALRDTTQTNSDNAANDVTMKEATPRARMMMMMEDYITFPPDRQPSSDVAETEAAPSESLTSSAQKNRQRTHFHFSEDSIFSSVLDFSKTMTIKRSLLVHTAIKTSADPERLKELLPNANLNTPTSVHTLPITLTDLPASSQSDKEDLREMFSTLGIDGLGIGREHKSVSVDDVDMIGKRMMSEDAEAIRDTVPPGAGSTTDAKRAKRRSKGAKYASKRRSTGHRSSTSKGLSHRFKTTSLDSSSPPKPANGKKLPTVRMRIDDEPLEPSSDGDDELLLTSRGWDWEP